MLWIQASASVMRVRARVLLSAEKIRLQWISEALISLVLMGSLKSETLSTVDLFLTKYISPRVISFQIKGMLFIERCAYSYAMVPAITGQLILGHVF